MKLNYILLTMLGCATALRAGELVRADADGVIRWNADGREVALFGANYCLSSATDYRAAGYIGADRKKLVEQDMAHFARMGWDALRISFWGDWENSDAKGNLIVNDHLDVMDYTIAEAKKRGIYVLFTPITTYSAWWPDGKESDPYQGFSNHFQKSELGTNPAAIAAQCNYLRQILEHVNPYTGIALKDEPQIIFIEMINEPTHHPEDFGGSVAYINALVDAVRSTGCQKILFHNLTQDMHITAAIKASRAQGVTLAWYPTCLIAGHTLEGNYLRTVDDFTPMFRPDLQHTPKIVYEFDSGDLNTGYMYPAMARAFRGVGAQFATMFAYDMLATAPYNLGWQTHFLNLVYSPRKAMSAVIAAEVIRTLPRNVRYGDYPDNRRFGPFRVSYEEDSSEMVTDEVYLNSNDTTTAAPAPAKLRRIAGVGSSPLVAYEGNGTYFLDRLSEGLWRLEVYPDAVIVQDPFSQKGNHETVCSRLVWREWPMNISLPDLGDTFLISALNDGNTRHTQASASRFTVSPGVYLLSRDNNVDRTKLPARLGQIGLSEFVCPPPPVLPAQILTSVPRCYESDQPLTLAVDVVDTQPPENVTLYVRTAGQAEFKPVVLPRQHGYRHASTLQAQDLPRGGFDYYVTAKTAKGLVRFPAAANAVLNARAVTTTNPLILFDAATDSASLLYTRIDEAPWGPFFQSLPAQGATKPAALRLLVPPSLGHSLDDYTASLAVKTRIAERRQQLARTRSIHIKAHSSAAGQSIWISLVEADGTAWSKRLQLSSAWTDYTVPLTELTIAEGVKLPLGYPERWNYWSAPAKGRGGQDDRLNPVKIEHLQISLHPQPSQSPQNEPASDAWVEIASIGLVWE